MPTFVPSIFSSTISDGSAMNRSDSASPKCLSSPVPFEPNRWGVLGYLVKLSRELPMTALRPFEHAHPVRRAHRLVVRPNPSETHRVAVAFGHSRSRFAVVTPTIFDAL